MPSSFHRCLCLVSAVEHPLRKSGPLLSESRGPRNALLDDHFCSSSQARATPAWQSCQVISVRVEDTAQKAPPVTRTPRVVKRAMRAMGLRLARRGRRVRGKAVVAMSGLVAGWLLDYSTRVGGGKWRFVPPPQVVHAAAVPTKRAFTVSFESL